MDIHIVLTDFYIISLLLFISQYIRNKIAFLQNYYIPSSLIAGFLALILGEQFLNIISLSKSASGYPYMLVCILFSGIFLGKSNNIKIKEIFNKVGDTFFINTAGEIISFGISCFLGAAIIKVFFSNVFQEIALLLPAGFAGGHGYAAAIGGALNNLLNRTDSIIIGQTFATIGLLTGIFGGLICINYGIKIKETKFIKSINELPDEYKTGMLTVNKRKIMGYETIYSMVLDPLAWHVSLILLITGIGYYFYGFYKRYFPEIEVPLMCICMLIGVLFQGLLKKMGYSEYVDKKVVDRLGSTITDYLVAFGVATIKISVVINYAFPILILSILGILWPIILVFFIGKKLFRNYWFERSIFIFGYLTGIVAIGILLLRIVDPEMKSETLNDFGIAYTLQSIIELFLISILPILVVKFGILNIGFILTIIGIILLGICKISYRRK